jgi:hypothetical protein
MATLLQLVQQIANGEQAAVIQAYGEWASRSGCPDAEAFNPAEILTP